MSDPVRFIDQTMRDGPQSHWGMRLHPDMVLPIAPVLDRAGYHALDAVGSSIFEIQVRHLRVDPWQALDDIVAACPNFEPYYARLRRALQTAEDGDMDYVVSPRVDSVHTVWMEIHEDYRQTQGISREVEGSY